MACAQSSQIGQELDQLEQQILDEESRAAAGPSSNLDESGMFSIQVLAKALEVWHLTAVPTDNQELRQAGFDPQQQEAFICNLQVKRRSRGREKEGQLQCQEGKGEAGKGRRGHTREQEPDGHVVYAQARTVVWLCPNV